MTTGIGGIGESVPRQEDARFIRGRGNYVDDVVLPHMLHLALQSKHTVAPFDFHRMSVQIDTRFSLQRRVNLPYDPLLVVFRPHGKLSPHVLRLH